MRGGGGWGKEMKKGRRDRGGKGWGWEAGCGGGAREEGGA